MRYKDNIEWLKSLKQQIGQTQHRDLWHFEQVIDETIENLKPLEKPHGRPIDADRLKSMIEKYHCNGCDNYNGARCSACCVDDCFRYIDDIPTIIEAEGVNENS